MEEERSVLVMIDFIDEQLEKMGYTKENFKGSRMELVLKSAISSTEEIIQEETLKLMKEHSLSYGEARIIVISNILNSIK